MMEPSTDPLVELRDLSVDYFRGRRRSPVHAADQVSLSIAPKRTLGLVGESGSGKSTTGAAILGLVPIAGGSVSFDGEDITHATYARRRELSSALQVIFQDPYGSLNPARTVGQTLAETLRPHGALRRATVDQRIALMLQRVGLPADAADRYPVEFSGGQRQRVAIARALMVSPQFVVCDEPVSSLDISVQAQVLNLLRELQEAFGVSYLFISHDLAVVRHVAHEIAVMYRGRVVEYGDAGAIESRPKHPYTRALLEAAPVPDPNEQRRRREVRRIYPSQPQPVNTESCGFASRCPHVVAECLVRRPQLTHTPDGTQVACHRWYELCPPEPPNSREE